MTAEPPDSVDPAGRTDPGDPGLRRARLAALSSLLPAVLTSLTMPGVGVLVEHRPMWVFLGAVGVVLFTVAQTGALYAAVTPWLGRRYRWWLLAGFPIGSVLSVPLLAPVGADEWQTWSWVAASVAGSAPLLYRRWTMVLVVLLAMAGAALIAVWVGDSVTTYVGITVGIGATVTLMSGLPLWLWDLLLQAQAGKAAQARLSVAEERLRFARDVHDLLGHDLSVIALKAELAARLASVDAERASAEAGEVQRLAGTALADLRAAVHAYREVDLDDQLTAVEQLLRSSGVRCVVRRPEHPVPADIAAQLAPVLREASTNLLRHSTASWCTIDIDQDDDEVRMTVTNDGAESRGPDRYSHGLRGLSERLATAGGVLRTTEQDGEFGLRVSFEVRR